MNQYFSNKEFKWEITSHMVSKPYVSPSQKVADEQKRHETRKEREERIKQLED